MKTRSINNDTIIKFSMCVNEFILENDYNYIEGFIEYCKKYDLDIETAAKMVSPNLKSKIEIDAIEQHLMKRKSAKLPL